MTATTTAIDELVEVAALRIAQKGGASKEEINDLVRGLRRAVPEWLYVNRVIAVRELCERFGVS